MDSMLCLKGVFQKRRIKRARSFQQMEGTGSSSFFSYPLLLNNLVWVKVIFKTFKDNGKVVGTPDINPG